MEKQNGHADLRLVIESINGHLRDLNAKFDTMAQSTVTDEQCAELRVYTARFCNERHTAVDRAIAGVDAAAKERVDKRWFAGGVAVLGAIVAVTGYLSNIGKIFTGGN